MHIHVYAHARMYTTQIGNPRPLPTTSTSAKTNTRANFFLYQTQWRDAAAASGKSTFLFGGITVNEIVFVGYDDEKEDLELFEEDAEPDDGCEEENDEDGVIITKEDLPTDVEMA